jgi:Inorganic pyrophosphatase
VDAPLTCVMEIPKGSRNKYEYDPKLGGIRLDRLVSASVVQPPITGTCDFFSDSKDIDSTRYSEVKGWDDRNAGMATISAARE